MTSGIYRSRRIGLVVVGFWLVMTGFLVYREFGGTSSISHEETRTLAWSTGEAWTDEDNTESWMGLFAGEDRVGHVHVKQAAEERYGQRGVKMEIYARARLSLLGQSSDLEVTGSVWRPFETRRAEFEFAVDSQVDVRVEGRLEDGRLEADVVTGGGEATALSLPIDDELVFSSGFSPSLQFPSLEVGETAQLESFDPLTLRKSPLRVHCAAEETLEIAGESISTRRLEIEAGALASQVWIDGAGNVVRMTTPIGLTLEMIAPLG